MSIYGPVDHTGNPCHYFDHEVCMPLICTDELLLNMRQNHLVVELWGNNRKRRNYPHSNYYDKDVVK